MDAHLVYASRAIRAMVCGVSALLLLGLVLALHTPAVAAPLFAAPLSFNAGSYPSSVAIADLNGDGKLDLVVANNGSNTASVLLGNGDGTFGAKTDFATGTGPISVAIADLNGDAKPDLVVANGSAVSVLLGNGDGTFGAKRDFGTGPNSRSVAIGDLNGDGKLDLAVAHNTASSNAVSVLLGNGDGTFGTLTDYATGLSPQWVVIGDLNGDGKSDLAVAAYGAYAVSVLLGNGDGRFGAERDFETAPTPRSVAIGDLNGDGKPDLAVASFLNDTVSVLLGNGDGTFAPMTNFGTGYEPHSVAIGDLNGDGKPDLVTANFFDTQSPTVSVLLGNGDGTFGANTDYATGTGPRQVAIGDLNGDGRPDLVTANWYANTVSVLLNTGAVASVGQGPLLKTLQLSTPRPNPARGDLQIHFLLPRSGRVDAEISDLQGRRVRTLSSGQDLTAGEHVLAWDGRNGAGTPAPTGIFLIRVRAGGESAVGRIVLLR